MTKVLKLLCGILFAFILMMCCTISIETSLAVIVGTIGSMFIVSTVIDWINNAIKKVGTPNWYDYVQLGCALIFTILFTVAFQKVNLGCLIAAIIFVVLFVIFIVIENLYNKKKAK